ncbi:MAG TPA: LysE family transporter [Thermomicrobiales bacterium]|jgi:threonine/homoserine/homoserine lactone efflux protein
MLELAWLGIALGASAALAIGPIFAAIVHESIARGFGAGLRVSLGASVVDLAFLVPALLFAQALDLMSNAAFWIGLLGALVFLHRSGVAFRDAHRFWRATSAGSRSAGSSFYLGIVGNLMNPLTWGFWLATGVPALLRARQIGAWGGVALLVIIWFGTLLILEVLLALLVTRTGRALGGRGQACCSVGVALLFLALAGTFLARNVLPHAFG